MNLIHGHITGKHDFVMKRWCSLRNQFLSFLRRLDKPSGADGRRPFFRHENALAFLKGVSRPVEEQ